MPSFTPPTADTVPPFGWLRNGQPHPGNDLFRHYKNRARGQTVLKLDGAYITTSYPLQDQIDAASEVYLGGHIYEVTNAVANALAVAGYDVVADDDEGYGVSYGSSFGL